MNLPQAKLQAAFAHIAETWPNAVWSVKSSDEAPLANATAPTPPCVVYVFENAAKHTSFTTSGWTEDTAPSTICLDAMHGTLNVTAAEPLFTMAQALADIGF